MRWRGRYVARVGNARPYICQQTVLLLKTGLWASLFNYILYRPLCRVDVEQEDFNENGRPQLDETKGIRKYYT